MSHETSTDALPPRVGYRQAAAFLGLRIGTLRAMVHRKQVPHIRLGPRLVVFDVRRLGEYLQSKEAGCELQSTGAR